MAEWVGRLARAAASLGACWCTWSTPAFATGASLDTATSWQTEAASDAYRAGTDALAAQRLDAALALFRQSYSVVESPNSHLMIARVLVKMGRGAEAYAEFEATAREADAVGAKSEKYKKTASMARAELAELDARVGFVVVNLDGTIAVGDRLLSPKDFGRPLVVDPGVTEITLKLSDGTTDKRRVPVKAGERVRVDVAPPTPGSRACPPEKVILAPAPPPAPEGIDQRSLALVAGGVGVAGLATFAVFGLLDRAKYRYLQDHCPGMVCDEKLAGDTEQGRTYQTLANVGLGVGAVGVVSGLVLVATAPPSRAESPREGRGPVLEVGASAVRLRGSF